MQSCCALPRPTKRWYPIYWRGGRPSLSARAEYPRARTWLGRPGRSILGAPVQQLLRSSVMQAHQNYIAGEWVVAAAAAPNINPSNVADIVGEYARADEAQVRAAIASARGAFPAWSRGSIQARADALDKIGNEILARKEELGTLLSREEGKTKPEGIGEATRAGYLFKFFAGECVVFKPADLVPGSAWALADILSRSGLPKGVFNLVMGRGSVVGELVSTSPDVDAVSFTGSVETGKRVAQNCVARLAKVQLE